ncbi:tetratricopeptide repeat-containing sensor histidine kinase [Ekhidna sp.]|uniref:tetratricopeptide repeat-containing sensor histidine kinase n=1 Tax=Ekhidna sp. TaxID=2608089 RepID=UPI003C7CC177
MNITRLITLALLIFVSLNLYAQKSQQELIIDSLESYRPIAEPGWDELDLCIGLYRLYLFNGDVKKADEQVARIYEIGRTEEIPIAAAYGRIMENLKAYIIESDDDKAIRLCLEAIEIARHEKNQEALAYARYQLAENYYFEKGEPEKAIELILESLKEVDETVTIKTLGNTHKTIGHVYGQIGEYEKGLKHLRIALKYFKQLTENPPVHPKIGRRSALDLGAEMHTANTLNYIGDLHVMQGNISSALTVKIEALDLMEKLNNKDMTAWMYSQTGKLYAEIGNLNQAVSDFQKSRLLFEELGFEKDIHRVNETMIPTLVRMSEYELAEQLTEDNIRYYTKTKDTLYLASTYVHASGIFLMLEAQIDLKKSKKYLDKAEGLVKQITDQKIEALFARMRGMYAKRTGDFIKAHLYLNEALQISSASNKLFNARVTFDIADNFLLQSEYDSSKFYANNALNLAFDLKDRDLSMDCYKLLSDIGAAANDMQEAYANHVVYFKLYDSLFTTSATAKLKEEQVRQGIFSYQRDKELAEENARLLESRNNLFLIVGAFLLIIIGLMIYLYFSLRKVKAKTQSQNQQLTQLNQTKDKFFGIIAHDLRSPLIGLQGVGDQVDYFLKKGNTDRLEQLSRGISDTTKKLNELLDNLLNWALLQNGMIPYHPKKVDMKASVESVIDLLTPLADVKGVILKNNIEAPAFVYADDKAVLTILRNLISNSLKFTEPGGTIVVDVQDQEDHASILINDTGTGISTEMIPRIFDLEKESKQGTMGEKGTGLGLVLCKELVELNHGSIHVASKEGEGSTFSFNLPKAA